MKNNSYLSQILKKYIIILKYNYLSKIFTKINLSFIIISQLTTKLTNNFSYTVAMYFIIFILCNKDYYLVYQTCP